MSTTSDVVQQKAADENARVKDAVVADQAQATAHQHLGATVENAKQPALASVSAAFTKASEAVSRFVGSSIQLDVDRRRNAPENVMGADNEALQKRHDEAVNALKDLALLLDSIGIRP